MSDKTQNNDHLESFPGGITEKDEKVPSFLKITYVFFVVFAVGYWFLWNAGDSSNPYVQELNRATTVVMP